MQFFLGAYTIDTDQLIADWSSRVIACDVRTGAHGDESLEIDLDVPFLEVFYFYQQLGPLKIRCSWGAQSIFTGRIEDPTQIIDQDTGLKIVALGYWVALSDIPITALWSNTQYNSWRQTNQLDIASRTPDKYTANQTNQLYLATTKGIVFNNGTDVGSWVTMIPDSSSRQIIGISLDYVLNLPVNWVFQIIRHNSGFVGSAGTTIFTGTGAQVSRSYNTILTACDYVELAIFNNTGANSTPAGETGANFIRITDIRIVTSTTNRISTTFTANRNAGTNVTATVGSTTGMYVGQRLQINNNGNPSESVIILSIGSSTQFNATFVNNYVIGNPVQAHVVYPDEIIKDCVAVVNAINSTQINSTTAVQSQAIDIDQLVIEDRYPNDVINDLIARGDNQSPPRQWVAQVFGDQVLRVGPRGSGRAWYIDIDSLEVVRTLTQLFNSVYVVYRDANDRKLRSAASTDSASVVRYKITRRKAVQSEATTAILATTQRDAILAAQADPLPRASIAVSRVFDQYGVEWPLWFVKADATVTLRNLPVTLATVYDKLRTLIVARTTYDALEKGEYPLTLELEVSMPNVDVQLANALRG